jgi:formamidopyrimidine-DNA glycosylase
MGGTQGGCTGDADLAEVTGCGAAALLDESRITGLGNAFRAEVLHGMRCRRLVPPTFATSRSEQRDLTTRCAIGRARMGRWDAVRAFGTSAACRRASV